MDCSSATWNENCSTYGGYGTCGAWYHEILKSAMELYISEYIFMEYLHGIKEYMSLIRSVSYLSCR